MLKPISGIANNNRYCNSLRGIYLVYGYEKETKYFSRYFERDSGGADGAAHSKKKKKDGPSFLIFMSKMPKGGGAIRCQGY
jgi:hypothetical protein